MELRARLLGSWRLASWQWRDEAGEVDSPLGNDPIGLLTYDDAGTMSAQLMRRNQPHFVSDDWRRATDEEKTAAWSGYFAYFGRYSVNEDADAITHYVEGSSFPNLVGTQQLRYCALEQDRLTLAADTPWGRVVLAWKKLTVATIDPNQLRHRTDRFKIFDIRKNPDDRQIPGSLRVDGAALETGEDLPFGGDENVVLYCGSGNSCSRIANTLRDRGYHTVALEGGYKAWVEAGFPTEERL